MQALGLTTNGGHGLDQGARHVVVDVVSCQAPAAGLGVGAQG